MSLFCQGFITKKNTVVNGGTLSLSLKLSNMWMCFNDEWTFHSFFFFLIPYKKVRGTQNTETPGSKLLAFDPRPAGVQGCMIWKGTGATMSQHRDIYCPPFPACNSLIVMQGMFHESGVWSVTLVAKWRELILVIQTDRALGELVLWENLTLLGSTILRVTWWEKGGGKGHERFEKFKKPLLR